MQFEKQHVMNQINDNTEAQLNQLVQVLSSRQKHNTFTKIVIELIRRGSEPASWLMVERRNAVIVPKYGENK